MEEKIEEIIDGKTIFQNTLDVEIFSRFLGLWIMKMEIPKDIFEYVLLNSEKISDIDTHMIVMMILGAPDTKNPILRQMIKSVI